MLYNNYSHLMSLKDQSTITLVTDFRAMQVRTIVQITLRDYTQQVSMANLPFHSA